MKLKNGVAQCHKISWQAYSTGSNSGLCLDNMGKNPLVYAVAVHLLRRLAGMTMQTRGPGFFQFSNKLTSISDMLSSQQFPGLPCSD